MAYLTISDLEQRLGGPLYARLTDRVGGETADALRAEQIVAEAAILLDAYLGRRYRTPVDTASRPALADLLRMRGLDLAEYLAWLQSPLIADMPSRVRQLHAATLDWLGQVAAGRLVLPDDPPGRTGATSPLTVRGTPRRFTHEELDEL